MHTVTSLKIYHAGTYGLPLERQHKYYVIFVNYKLKKLVGRIYPTTDRDCMTQ